VRRLAIPLNPAAVRDDRLLGLDRWMANCLRATLAPASVQLQLWDGSLLALASDPVGTLAVRDRGALWGLVLNPELAFGEAYMAGRVAIRGDFAAVLERLSMLSRPGPPSVAERIALRLSRSNGLTSARRNVHHHYDLGNDFYALWLDPQMVYTCAWYPSGRATLAEAQVAKLDLVCRKLRLRPGDRVVEAGCGWGALALHMARNYGVTVHAYNISTEQISYAKARAAEERLDHLVTFIEDDFRRVSGRYDVFVSIGMLEHVGRREYLSLAAELTRLIDPRSGRGLLHFIGRDHPRRLNAWIRRRIFPGAYPPTLAEVTRDVLEPANMSVLHVENLRPHYARTLADWRSRFEAVEPRVVEQFGEPFYRAWRLYLAGSEAAFRTGWLQLFQVTFAPSGGRARSHHDADL
jgi:cyclopropane-fatty-acyl-phospholipid synthase